MPSSTILPSESLSSRLCADPPVREVSGHRKDDHQEPHRYPNAPLQVVNFCDIALERDWEQERRCGDEISDDGTVQRANPDVLVKRGEVDTHSKTAPKGYEERVPDEVHELPDF